MAYQSPAVVNASADVPSGRTTCPGNTCSRAAPNELNFAINKPTIMMKPAMIVTVIVMTRIFSHFSADALEPAAGVSFMQSGTRIWEVKVGGDAPQRLDKALASGLPEEAGLSRSRITGLIRAGCVKQGGHETTEPDKKTLPGDVWTIHPGPAVPDGLRAENIPLEVLYEDADLIVIDKPAGLVVHPGRGRKGGTLVNALLHRCGDGIRSLEDPARPGIVHRLDKDTTGVMVAAKTGRAALSLAEQFSRRTVSRFYHAVVRGVPPAGRPVNSIAGLSFEPRGWLRMEGAIGRHRTQRQRMAVVSAGGRHAVTRLRLLRPVANGEASLIECRLETGRTHQIRVHLEFLGHPVIGDQVYGASLRLLPESAGETARDAAARFPRQALHALSLEFTHPADGERMRFETGYPDDMRTLLSALSDLGGAISKT